MSIVLCFVFFTRTIDKLLFLAFLDSNFIMHVQGHRDHVLALAVSSDGTVLASGTIILGHGSLQLYAHVHLVEKLVVVAEIA